MTKEEAQTALKNGHKVTHRHFASDEYIYQEGQTIRDEKGYSLHDFWLYRQDSGFNDGWEILEPKDFNTQDFLNEYLQKRDKALGLDGEFTFLLSVEIGDEIGDNEYTPILGVQNLTRKAAQILFDQFDESNLLFGDENGNPCHFKIQILKDKEEINMNLLPNIHTTQH